MPADDDRSAAAAGAGDPPPRLFVYGSLRAGESGPMSALLHGASLHLGPATIRGRIHAVSWYCAATVSDEPGDAVHGDLFELDPAAAGEVLAALDEYEGSAFERRPVDVLLGGETRVSAFAYLWAGSMAGLPRVVSGEWPRGRSDPAAPLANPAEFG